MLIQIKTIKMMSALHNKYNYQGNRLFKETIPEAATTATKTRKSESEFMVKELVCQVSLLLVSDPLIL